MRESISPKSIKLLCCGLRKARLSLSSNWDEVWEKLIIKNSLLFSTLSGIMKRTIWFRLRCQVIAPITKTICAGMWRKVQESFREVPVSISMRLPGRRYTLPLTMQKQMIWDWLKNLIRIWNINWDIFHRYWILIYTEQSISQKCLINVDPIMLFWQSTNRNIKWDFRKKKQQTLSLYAGNLPKENVRMNWKFWTIWLHFMTAWKPIIFVLMN